MAEFDNPAAPLRYVFIDFNAYFASVEQYDDPALIGRPVIVTPLPGEHSGAIAASYEARRYGIARGTSVREARALCPDIAVRPARHDRYVVVHHMLMREIERLIPIEQIRSVDECVCRLGADQRDTDSALRLARAIKRHLYRTMGPALRCSIGIAPSILLAKLASDLDKPDGLQLITMDMLPGRLADLPLRAVPGIGRAMLARLGHAGVLDFAGLWALAPKQARKIWGSVQGERFAYALHGHDILDMNGPDKTMIGHGRVLSGPWRRPDRARIVARALLLRALSRLRHHGLYASQLYLSVKFYTGRRDAGQLPLRASQNSWRFLRALDQLWFPLMQRGQGQGRYGAALANPANPASLPLSKLSVHLAGLSPLPPEPDLFVCARVDERDRCEAGLWWQIDALNRRYGMQRICLASHAGMDLHYLGVKIAFNRVPEISEFMDNPGAVPSLSS